MKQRDSATEAPQREGGHYAREWSREGWQVELLQPGSVVSFDLSLTFLLLPFISSRLGRRRTKPLLTISVSSSLSPLLPDSCAGADEDSFERKQVD